MAAETMIIFYFLAIVTLGYALWSVVLGGNRRPLCETVPMVMILGAGAMSLIFFWLALLGLKPSVSIIASVFVVSSAGIALLRAFRRTAAAHIPGKWHGRELVLLFAAAGILVAACCIVAAHSLFLPLYDVDSYGLWGLKAKALYHEGLVPGGGFFHELSLSYSHLNYPLLVPFLVSGIYASAGEVNDLTGKLIFTFLYIACTLLIYSSLRWRLDRSRSLLLTVLFMTLPATLRWAGAGMSDFPLAVFFSASAFYLCRFLEEHRREDMILSALATVFCAFVKHEGIASAAICLAVIACCHTFLPFSKSKLKDCAIYCCLVGVLMLPWFWWYSGVPHTHENYPLRIIYFFSQENLLRTGEILVLFLENFSNVARWGLLWLLLPVAMLLDWRRLNRRYVLAMWLLLVGRMAAYFFVFIISPWTPEFLAQMALERILLHAAPAALFIIAFHMASPLTTRADISTSPYNNLKPPCAPQGGEAEV